MARDSKIEVAAVNIRIHAQKKRNYAALIAAIYKARQGINVYGDSHVAITHFDEDTGWGIFSKYTEIDLDGAWFDTGRFDAANPSDVGKVNIPSNLKPNLSQYYFLLDPKLHTIAFECYSDSRSLSLNAVHKYFLYILAVKSIVSAFGAVEATIISNHMAARALLALPNLKEVRVTIRRPNPDDVGDDLAEVIEKRLTEQKADEYEEALRVRGAATLKPSMRTKKLAVVAAENGEVRVKSLVNGVMVSENSASTPLKEVIKYKADEAATPHFLNLAAKIFKRVRRARRQVSG